MAEHGRIDMTRYRNDLTEEVALLVKKHCRIMVWEVPELGEQAARERVLGLLREVLVVAEGVATACPVGAPTDIHPGAAHD